MMKSAFNGPRFRAHKWGRRTTQHSSLGCFAHDQRKDLRSMPLVLPLSPSMFGRSVTVRKSLLSTLSSQRNWKSLNFTKSVLNRYFSVTVSPCLQRRKLVLLGTGWSCYSVLRNVDKKKFDVIVVSPRNHFLFTPLLTSTTVGTLEFRSITEPVRNTSFRDDHHFQLARATQIDPDNNKLICEADIDGRRYELNYDYMVIGVGALSNTFGIPGVSENAFFLKEVADARAIRNKIISNFELSLYPSVAEEEKKRLLHFVIVGGGPTGIEFGAELYDFIVEDVSRIYSQEKNDVKVTLIEANEILPSFDQKLQSFAIKKLKQRKNYSLLKARVVEVCEDHVRLEDGTILPCGMVLWSTGLAPRPFINNLPYPKSRSGQLMVNKYLKVTSVQPGNVFAVGDCSFIGEDPLPCTAQVAEREGRYLAKALSLYADGKDELVEPFSWTKLGMLAYIGEYDALADLPFKGGKLTGLKTWFLWRSAYLTRLGSWRLRMQVPFDWTRTFLFGRDTTKF